MLETSPGFVGFKSICMCRWFPVLPTCVAQFLHKIGHGSPFLQHDRCWPRGLGFGHLGSSLCVEPELDMPAKNICRPRFCTVFLSQVNPLLGPTTIQRHITLYRSQARSNGQWKDTGAGSAKTYVNFKMIKICQLATYMCALEVIICD